MPAAPGPLRKAPPNEIDQVVPGTIFVPAHQPPNVVARNLKREPSGADMTQYAELEIELERQGADSFAVDLRFHVPDSDADVRDKSEGHRICIDELRQLGHDPLAYGRRLGQDVFQFPVVRESLAVVEARRIDLRFRLSIAPADRDLHGLRWETLTDPDAPQPGTPLLMNERMLFSRYVDSRDWRAVTPRAKGDLRALVVVANPSDLSRFKLAPIDVPDHVARARNGMTGINSIEVLGEHDRASMKNIVERLRTGPDILYLVCHGTLDEGKSVLWFEQEDGTSDRRDGSDLVAWLGELKQPPRLVVLASCQSAGTGEVPVPNGQPTAQDAVWDALGPRLGASGVPAVLAMHGYVTVGTVDLVMETFFRELQRDGIVDRAMAIARGAVRDRADAWSPVLYMRLKSGSLWSEAGFSRDTAGRRYEVWPALLNHIEAGNSTPILGPGMTESLIGPRREIARSWAETYQFPLAKHFQDDLPQVAQYVYVNQQDRQLLLDELGKSVRDGLLSRLGNDVSEDLRNADIDTLLVEIAKRHWTPDSDEPHWVLAQAPFEVFVTTALDRVMAAALRAVGKEPREDLFAWNEYGDWPPSVKETEPSYVPSAQQPLVYHLFGRLDVEDSLVITEDDYLDYLLGAARNRDLLSDEVRAHLAETSLLFLGYEMDGWDFRVLFRSIMSHANPTATLARRRKIAHAGVQVDLTEARIQKIERAREYLQSYFRESNIHIYWGSVEDFSRDLRRQRGNAP